MKLITAPTDMTQGKPLGLLLRFSIPLLIGNIFQQLYNIVDSLVAGNYLSTQALAAVGIGNYPMRVLLALFIGLGTGATIRISHYVGAASLDNVRRVLRTANGMMLIVALPLTLLGVLITRPILTLMNTPADTMQDAATYLSIFFLGVLPLLGYNLNAGILRGLGDSRSSVLFLIIATIINVILDLVFVLVFGWGVAGVAIATLIAMGAAWILSHLFIRRHYPQYAAPLFPVQIDKESFRDIVRLGLPIGLNDALFALGHMILSSLVNSHGSAFAAGYSVGGKVDAISFMPLTSFAAATTTFVGQNVGAGEHQRVRQGARTAVLLSVSWSIIGAVIMLTFGHQLVGLFDSNPEVIQFGYAYIVRLEPLMWIYAIMFTLNAVMNGAGEVRVPMIANMVLFWLARLPAAYLLSALRPPADMMFCYPIGWLAGLLITGPYFLTGRWQRHFKPKTAAQEDVPSSADTAPPAE